MNAAYTGEIHLFTDGASRGNPGLAGAGFYAEKSGAEILSGSLFLGEKTNNEAEYLALCAGLERLLELGYASSTPIVHADSELMVRQLQGRYKVKAAGLLDLYKRAKELLARFAGVKLVHVAREKNTIADRLANKAIDERS